jgi:branched-chain amino acid transport system ATP-binding protein
MPDGDVFLETRNVSKHYGAVVAVDNVTFRVRQGRIHSIIGPNGAGKTTFFNLLTGLAPATSGSVTFRGRDITKLPFHRMAGIGIGRAFQRTQVFPELSVLENVRLACQSVGRHRLNPFVLPRRGSAAVVAARDVLGSVALHDKADEKAAVLSHGDLRALDVAIALALKPSMLLLDEPTAGMSPPEVHATTGLITRLRDELEITILLVEHNMNLVMSISDVITVFHRGQILAEDTPERIKSHEGVRAAYIGSQILA